MGLLTMPKEILINLFCLLRIRDLVVLQSTCSLLRNVAESRRIWLLELQRLVDMTCIPASPLYVDPHPLDHAAIRSLVAAAYRWIAACKKSLPSTGFTGLRSKSVSIELGNLSDTGQLLDDSKPLLFYRLLPSAEFLIVAHSNALEIFRVPGGSRVWSYFPLRTGEEAKLVAFTFEELSKNSFRLVVVRRIGPSSLSLQLFTLQKRAGEEPMEVQRVAYDEMRDIESDLYCVCLEGDYVVLHVEHCLIVWDWKEEKLTEIILDVQHLHDLHILREHLFLVFNSRSTRCALQVIPLRQFHDSAPLLSYADVKRFSHEPSLSMSDFWMAGTPKIVLYDLRRFGISDEVKCVLILDVISNGIRRTVPVHFIIDLFASDDSLFDAGATFRQTRVTQPVLSNPFVQKSILVPSDPGCVVHNRRSIMPDDRTFRLRANDEVLFLGFDENGEVYRSHLPGTNGRLDMVIEFDCRALIQSFPHEHPRRMVIHYFI